jgi:hypothetical protein
MLHNFQNVSTNFSPFFKIIAYELMAFSDAKLRISINVFCMLNYLYEMQSYNVT